MKNSRSKEDIVDVSGVRKSDVILQVGKNLPFLSKFVKRSDFIDNPDAVPYTEVYDKIFVNCSDLDEAFLGKLCCINVGTIIFLDVPNALALSDIREIFETKWYPANAWDLNSNIGRCLITDAKGPALKVAYEQQ